MTWTYSGNPATSIVDMIHYLVGDTDTNDQVATNEECQWAYDFEGQDPWLAAANVAEAKSRSYARQANIVKVGDTTINYGERAKDYLTLARTLREQSSIRTAMPYAGGISQGEKTAQEQDTDRVKPFATVKKHDYPGLGLPSSLETEP